jgi:hypothetical protein
MFTSTITCAYVYLANIHNIQISLCGHTNIIIEQKYIKCLQTGLKMCFREMQTLKYVGSFHFIVYPERDTDNSAYLIKEQFSTQQYMNTHSTTYCICTLIANT